MARRRDKPDKHSAMELVSIALARIVAFLEVEALDPFGKTSTSEAISSLRERYLFSQVPRSFAEIDFSKGVELAEGRMGDLVIDKITLYTNGIMIDTRSSTEDSESVLLDLLNTAKEVFGATVQPARKHFVSQIVFRSEIRLAALNPILQNFADRMAKAVSSDLQQTFIVEPTGIHFSVDNSQVRIIPGQLTIERRTDTPFSEKTYYSQAAFRTNEHLALIREFEAALL